MNHKLVILSIIMAGIVGGSSMGLLRVGPARADPGITVAPFSFAPRGLGSFVPGGGPPAESHWVQDASGEWTLFVAKNVPTTEVAAAGAQILHVAGTPTTGLSIGFEVTGQCGAGAPRFNLQLETAGLVFLGCTYGNDGSGNVVFTAGITYGGVLFPTGDTIVSLSIIFDEQGSANLDDIFVGSDTVGSPNENGHG